MNTAHLVKYFWLSALLALLPMASTAADPGPLAPEWHDALKPLEGTPVQDFGFVRSIYTFGDNHLGAITDKSSYDGMDAMESVLYLMAKPEEAQKLPLLKVRPDLAKGLGQKRMSLAEYRQETTMDKLRAQVGTNQKLMDAVGDLDGRANHLESLEKDFAILPRPGEWLSPAQAAGAAQPLDTEIIKNWEALKQALRANDPKAGGQAANALAAAIQGSAKKQSIQLPHLEIDYLYHHHKPFLKAWLLYLLAAIAFGASMLVNRPALGWVGYAFMALGFLAQVAGTAARWVIAGRAPLSNMYESFTFAIGGLVLVALVFELIWRNRLAGLGGATLGFIFMVLAHKAPIFDIKEIRPLMPALQSSWLTYHVVVIMLSYSAFALSFFIALAYLGKDLLGGDNSGIGLIRRLPSLAALDLFNYKIIAVGFPLLTLGIIFGAVWAATAWGRPWGFDPKETWSAITWLIYAIYLHARYLAGWKGRLAAILAIFGFVAVLFTYVGVNYLLPGLHSYV